MSARIGGLYAVTPDVARTPELLERAEAALAGGARLLQYRNKAADAALRLVQGRALLALCWEYQVPLIINDHLDLALALDAPGLHLGSADGSVAEARARLGPGKVLGVSCYDQLERARAAARLGADYVAFGSFFPSRAKPGAGAAPISLLREARKELGLPLIAIGGITPENASQLIAAGADGVAVISALFEAGDVKHAARRFSALFARRNPAPLHA